jgi:hypothetical protein
MNILELNNLIDITLEQASNEFPFDFEDHEVELISTDLDVDMDRLLLEEMAVRKDTTVDNLLSKS